MPAPLCRVCSCAVEVREEVREEAREEAAVALGTLHHVSEAKTRTAMTLFFIPNLARNSNSKLENDRGGTIGL